jgi:hypothetical protein
MRRLALAGCFAFALAAAPPDAKDCVACHDQIDLEKRRAFSHGGLACIQCHTAITVLPHAEKLPSVKCGRCHKNEAEDYAKSVHGLARLKGNEHAATCSSCHGKAHEIISPHDPSSDLARKNMYAICGKCHDQAHLAKLPARLHRRGSRMNIQPLAQ